MAADLAMLVFKVMDKDTMSADDFVAAANIPVLSLNQGYRHVQLRSKGNTVIPHATLFGHLAFRASVVAGWAGRFPFLTKSAPPRFSVANDSAA